MDLPLISRRTDTAIPLYDDTRDVFVSNEFGKLTEKSVVHEGPCTIRTFYPAARRDYSRIRYFNGNDGGSYWEVTSKSNVKQVFGAGTDSRITDPSGSKVFAWLISQTEDSKGNKTLYEYERHNGNLYIKSISYGNYRDENNAEQFAFEISFSYTDKREDPFISFKSGFMLETGLLCESITMLNTMPQTDQVSRKIPVRKTCFSYDSTSRVSLLSEISIKGLHTDSKENLRQMNVPPLLFSFSKFQPEAVKPRLLEIDGSAVSKDLNHRHYQFLDLYGDGMPGILYNDDKTALFYAPMGDGKYAAPRVIKEFPIDKETSARAHSFMSLEGSGKYDLVISSPPRFGFYEQTNGEFAPFRVFESCPNEYGGDMGELADMQGDRLNHMVLASKNRIRYYPSLKKVGFGNPVETLAPDGFPYQTQSSPHQAVRYADMFADGLSHRVLVGNGRVEVYPNTGYGGFGEPIEMGNAPVFGEDFNAARLHFADIDGSGTEDLVYARSDSLTIYFNQCGKCFSGELTIELPETLTDSDSLSFADVNGMGYKSILFTKLGAQTKIYWFDLNSGKKPYLLEQIDDSMGMRSSIAYETSARLFLESRLNGIEWRTNAPFPVYVVKEIQNTDSLSKSVFTTKYHYKDACYDYNQRVFRGFGYTETWCSETFEGQAAAQTSCTKTWYHTGVRGIDYSCEFYTNELPFPKDVFEISDPLFLDDAYTALEACAIHEEVYGFDESGLLKVPYTAVHNNYIVTEAIPPRAAQPGSFEPTSRESFVVNYERQREDPRLAHTVTLETDSFGNILKQAEVYYGRPSPKSPEQAATRILLRENKFFNHDGAFFLAGVETESMSLEICCEEKWFTFGQLKEKIKLCVNNRAPYGAPAETGQNSALLIEHLKNYYWNKEQTECLAFGLSSERALLHHTAKAVFPQGFEAEVYQNKVTAAMLSADCGFVCEDGHWWNLGAVSFYYEPARFCLLYKQMNSFAEPWGNMYFLAEQEYDPLYLLPVRITNHLSENLKNSVEAKIDYNTGMYRESRDVNGVTSQVLYNPLGYVEAASVFGEEKGVRQGDMDLSDMLIYAPSFDDVIANPGKYIQKASMYFHFDLFAFQERKQPVSVICLSREKYVSDGDSPGRCTILYSDGLGRSLQTKEKTEEGWIVSGKTLFNSSGKEVLVYKPFLSSSPYFAQGSEASCPIIKSYDALSREIKTEFPLQISSDCVKYVFAKTEFAAWQKRCFDPNDNIKSSEYYRELSRIEPSTQSLADKKAALVQSEQFDNTPVIMELDVFGNVNLEISGGRTMARYVTDIVKREISAADSRLLAQNATNLINTYDMQGNIIKRYSPDAGTRLYVYNMRGEIAHSFDANQNHITMVYDTLGRLVKKYAAGHGLAEKIEYGETAPNSKSGNLAGRVYRHYDQGGIETNETYNIAGLVTSRYRTFCKTYKEFIDWERQNGMEPEQWRESFMHNAQGKIWRHITPEGVTFTTGYNALGLVKSVVSTHQQSEQIYIKNAEYSPNGLLKSIEYGNGVVTSYSHDEMSLRLDGFVSRKPDKSFLQDMSYAYDAAGNVARIRNNAERTLFTKNQAVEPVWDYSYDELYRLIAATGRELPAGAGAYDSEKLEAYTETYEYDSGGNLTKIRHRAPSTLFTKTMEVETGSNRLTKTDDSAVLYDGNGNITQMEHLRAIEWNWDNRLVRADIIRRDNGEPDSELYVYDYSGKRIRKVLETTGQTTQITEIKYIGSFEHKTIRIRNGPEERTTLERNSTTITDGGKIYAIRYFWLRDDLKRETDTANTPVIHFMLSSHTGSVCLELDEKAGIITCEEYYSFGGTAFINGAKQKTMLKKYRYGAKERDATGLLYFETRYYNCCRFISADDLSFIKFSQGLSLNIFAYCRNNPVKYIDPTGEDIHYFYYTDKNKRFCFEAKALADKMLLISEGHTVHMHRMDTRVKFLADWAAIGAEGDHTVIINTHATKDHLVTSKKTWIEDSTKYPVATSAGISKLLLLGCCAGGSPGSDAGSFNIAQKLLHKISPTGQVLASTDKVESMGGTVKREKGVIVSRDPGLYQARDKGTFNLYTRANLAGSSKTKLQDGMFTVTRLMQKFA